MKIKYFMGIGLCLLVINSAVAVVNNARGNVGTISYYDATTPSSLQKKVSFVFTPNDGSSFTCPNSVLVVEEGNETAVSILLTASTAGKDIHASWDTDVTIGGFCKLQTITLY